MRVSTGSNSLIVGDFFFRLGNRNQHVSVALMKNQPCSPLSDGLSVDFGYGLKKAMVNVVSWLNIQNC